MIDGAEGYTSQMDLVIVGNKGVYVVEVKMYNDAKVYGDVKKSKWYYYNHGKKYEIYSPLKQNQNHVKYMRSFLKPFGEIPIFSIITMICEDFKISGELDGSTVICNSLPAMEKGLYKIAGDRPQFFDDANKKEVFEYIKNNQHIGKEARREHKQNVIAYKNDIEEKKDSKVCPYCKTELVLKNGKYGEFYGCANYPKCKYTMKKDS